MLSRHKMLLSLGLFTGLSVYAALPTLAASTTYTFIGLGTGTIDGNDFTDQTFSLSLIEDSSGVTTPSTGIFITPTGKAKVTLAGFGTGTTTDSVHVFDNQTNSVAGLSDDTQRGDSFVVSAPEFTTFNLQPNFGPISIGFSSGTDLPTSIGDIVFTDVIGGKFSASSTPVPESSTLLSTGLLLTLGLGGLIAVSRKKKSCNSLS